MEEFLPVLLKIVESSGAFGGLYFLLFCYLVFGLKPTLEHFRSESAIQNRELGIKLESLQIQVEELTQMVKANGEEADLWRDRYFSLKEKTYDARH